MKSNFLKSIVYIVALGMLVFSCSTQTEKLPVDFDSLKVSGGAFAQLVAAEGDTEINRDDAASSSFSNTYQMVTPGPALGSDITLIEFFVSFAGSNVDVDEVLFSSVSQADFDTSGGGYPQASLSATGDEILAALGLVPAQLEGGDVISFRVQLTTPKGTFSDVSANFDNQSADHTYSLSVVCFPPIIPAGDYIVNMVDTFGDGWQSTTSNGGPGITVTLNTGEVIEVGMCTIYEAQDFDCVDGPEQASDVVTIPPGTTSADWYFPGDFWGEMEFTVIGPNSAEVIYSQAAGGAEGPFLLNLCNE